MKFRRQHRLICDLPGAVPIGCVMFLLLFYLLINSASLLFEGMLMVRLPKGAVSESTEPEDVALAILFPGNRPSGYGDTVMMAMDNRRQLSFKSQQLADFSVRGEDLQREIKKMKAKLTSLSAKVGNAKAQFSLGEMYRDGYGYRVGNDVVRKDLAKAYAWFKIAARNGLKEAKVEIKEGWHPSTVAKGEKLTDVFLKSFPKAGRGDGGLLLVLKADREVDIQVIARLASAAQQSGVRQIWLATRPRLFERTPREQ